MKLKKVLFWLVWCALCGFVWVFFAFRSGIGLASVLTGLVRMSVYEELVLRKRKVMQDASAKKSVFLRDEKLAKERKELAKRARS